VDTIIPTYNHAHLIATAVQVAMDQSWWNRQVTVIEDGSQGATEAALRP